MNAPPLLVSFASIDKYLEALPPQYKIQYEDEIKRLYTNGFPPIVSKLCLGVLFGYSSDFIYILAKKPSKFYRSFTLKQGKKTRKIFAPKVGLKVIQKWFATHLSNVIEFHPHVLGFVKGKSFADAAQLHIGARWVFSVDIVDFFPSISKEAVIEALIQTQYYTSKAAELISDLCCLNDALAQGSPASPVLSNIIMKPFDEKLLELSKKYNIVVSRYADDIVFSGKDEFDANLHKDLNELFAESCFTLNSQKQYFADKNKGQRLKVHGLLVKEEHITLTKGYRNKLRAYKHMLNQEKVSEKDIERLKGHVKFSEFIESKRLN
ncbi:reverse transcriptase family protein [Acinetobacter variabilis]|uniref:reverse transcriptase family protein n=1 Tax=Acinetobacter variabilis TaxID=70346 RepID=UPI0026735511|nr:reverse transcriptase family protein [Acinetobacter variabilis]WKT72199.1 reverse transcriptase family protein [Acinetobacter variabilis]